MRHCIAVVAATFMLALGVGFLGCASKAPDTSPQGTAGAASHQGGSGASDMDRMRAELAKLSPEDAAAAERQHICPVSGEMLGLMGVPMKVDVKGQTVWICCEACKGSLLENPDEHLAKLKLNK